MGIIGRSRARGGRLAVTCVTALGLLAYGVPAHAAITATTKDAAGANSLAQAMSVSSSFVSGASFVAHPTGTPHGVGDAKLSHFPSNGSSFAILSSGNAAFADDANNSGSLTGSLTGSDIRGTKDTTILKIDLNVPANKNCLTLDFSFYSEEYPEWVGTQFNDGFIAELDKNTWSVTNSVISAPDNFAFDPQGKVISINSSGKTAMNPAQAAGTTYDGGTLLLSASTEITPGAHSLYLSIFDAGDHILDSAALVDGLDLRTLVDGKCVEGAKPVPNTAPVATAAADATGIEGATLTTSGSFSDAEGDTLKLSHSPAVGTFTAAGNNWTWTLPTDDNVAGTVTVKAVDTAAASASTTFNYSASNANPSATMALAAGTGCSTSLSLAVADAGSADTHTGLINWGDGKTELFAGSKLTLAHGYGKAGSFTVTLSNLKDDDGGAGAAVTGSFGAVNKAGAFASPLKHKAKFKLGSTLPIKLQITSCDGKVVTNITPTVKLEKIPASGAPLAAVPFGNPQDGINMRLTGKHYTFNLQTGKSSMQGGGKLTKGQYRITVMHGSMPAASILVELT